MDKYTSKEKRAFYNLVYELQLCKIKVTPEYKFCPARKFKADFMLEYNGKQILVEYEGIYNYGKSRHTSKMGYTNDTEKYNIASKMGFVLLRYTASTYEKITTDVLDVFDIKQ
jgi:predicted nuclease of restriction endonuclease-like RecB superfamily